jgi:hypothetical protein
VRSLFAADSISILTETGTDSERLDVQQTDRFIRIAEEGRRRMGEDGCHAVPLHDRVHVKISLQRPLSPRCRAQINFGHAPSTLQTWKMYEATYRGVCFSPGLQALLTQGLEKK